MAGITPEGLVIKRLDEIVEELSASVKAEFGPTTNTDPDSVFGQLNGLIAEVIAEQWELAQFILDTQDPDAAEGVFLDNIGALVGVPREGASFTTGFITATGTDGTTITLESIVENSVNGTQYETTEEVEIQNVFLSVSTLTFVDNDPDPDTIVRGAGSWIADGVRPGTNVIISGSVSNDDTYEVAEVTATTLTLIPSAALTDEGPTGGVSAIVGRATIGVRGVETGPLESNAFEVDTIVTPISGWDTTINLEDFETGQDLETDIEYRPRREDSLQIAGRQVDDAIKANVLAISGVDHVLVRSNRSPATVDGIPPHAFETIVAPTIADSEVKLAIAEAIFLLQPLGIEAHGDEEFTVTDLEGFSQPVKFTFATEIDIWMTATLTVNDLFPEGGEQIVIDALLAKGDTLAPGDDVINYQFVCELDEIDGITDVVLTQGTAPGPTLEDNITIEFDEIADFDTSRMLVVLV